MTDSRPIEKPSRGSAWLLWPGIVIALLVGQIALSLTAATLAIGDRAQVVEPDYYGKALRWEQTRDELRASAAMGWTAEWDVAPTADLLGKRGVTLTLTDSQNQPITDASVKVSFFHHARSAERHVQPLDMVGRGVYSAVLAMRYEGLWQLDLRVEHGATNYVEMQTLWVGNHEKALR